MPTTADILAAVDERWPWRSQEDWDASGPVVGRPDREVRRVLLAVDAVRATVDEAIASGTDLLLTHHPLLMRGATSVYADRYKGRLVTDLIEAGCALAAVHTNGDVAVDGVSQTIAARLGLQGVRPLVARDDGVTGLGAIGGAAPGTTLGDLVAAIAAVAPRTAGGLRVAGDPDQPAETVALCGGAGDSLLDAAAASGADVYVTSDLRHHPAQEFLEQAAVAGRRVGLVDVAHWASESLWLPVAAAALRERFPGLEVAVSEANTDPFGWRPDR